jgi:DNA gyrase/topoisomerase IV subunit A
MKKIKHKKIAHKVVDTTIVKDVGIAEFTERSMTTYGQYVLTDRAVADVRDGLKPVQRRILYAAYKLGLYPNKSFVKSARLVGETMGKYHPHGDSSIYSTLVNMVRAPSPTMAGHGNFGTDIDQEVAAMRYTETRMTKLGSSMFDDIAVISLVPNYDGKDSEPNVLPARLPMLLVNGSEGIAVGLSAAIPPHNISEIVGASKELLDDPESETFLDHIKGPDYGSGVFISTRSEVERLYQTGKGSLRFRCKYHYETTDNTNLLVITEFGPRFRYGSPNDRGSFLGRCADLQEEGVIDGVSNETSHKTGLRIVVAFKSPKLLQDRFLRLLRTSIGFQFHTLYPDDRAHMSGIRGLLLQFIDFRRDIEEKVLRKDLADTEVALAREEAKLAALLNIDVLMDVLKKHKGTREELAGQVAKKLKITTEQGEFILTCQIVTLARMNKQTLLDKITDLKNHIKEIGKKLEDIDSVVRDRLDEMLKKFGQDRRMQVTKKEPTVVESVGTLYVGVTKGGDFNKFATFPRTNKQRFDFMAVTDDTITAVCQSGNARVVEVLTQKRGGLKIGKDKIVGIVPSTKQKMLVKDRTGKVLVLNQRDVRLRVGELDYLLLNTKSQVNLVVGFDNEDQVVCYNDSYLEVRTGNELKTKRRGSLGWRLLKGRRDYHVLVVPRGTTVVTVSGKTIRDFEQLKNIPADEVLVLSKNNIVTNGERKIPMSAMEISSKLSKGDSFDNVFQV